MAGMFYSLQETAEKLGKTEDQIRQLAKEGKLREFRDGASFLFKIEEVNALTAAALDEDAVDPELPVEIDEDSILDLVESEPEAAKEQSAELELLADDGAASELDLAPDLAAGEAPAVEIPEDDILADLGEDDFSVAMEATGADEISLAPEPESDITDMDTALTGDGISILGETDADYDITEDSLAETVGPAGTSTEASLEEIEDDVNLDSFGSGSGLLDLSLQADDTSLGGILDEIYTTEDSEDEATGDSEMLDDMTAEADHARTDDMVAPEPMVAVPTMAQAYAEAAPDSQGNILGMLLFLPLLALLYASIVAISAQREVMPSILESIQGLVWYIMGGAAAVVVLVVGVSFVVGGEKKPKAAKPKKTKKEKPKKQKKAKAEKPKKEKKSLFGKKK